MRQIRNPADLAEGAAYLAARDARMAQALAVVGELPLRLRVPDFQAMLDILVSQQLSVAAADTIWARLVAAGLVEPARILASTDDAMRACGLSRAKIRYARALAQAVVDGQLDFAALPILDAAEVTKRLTAITGIGQWSADIFLIFCLGDADGFAAGDLALQESARLLYGLDTRPSAKALAVMAEGWRPWRGVAARILWAYYRHAKSREGI